MWRNTPGLSPAALHGRMWPENTVTEELAADTADAGGTSCPGSAAVRLRSERGRGRTDGGPP